MSVSERIEAFLNELTELSKKHGLYIGGCTCYGSPWIWDKESGQIVAEYLDAGWGDEGYSARDLTKPVKFGF